jgi:fluoride exporter
MPSFLSVLYVALGGALGSISRYLLGAWALTLGKNIDFPYGTLAVNLIGCFVIGFLSQLMETRSSFTAEARAFIFIGLLGGFTTFSAFGNDTINLLREGRMFHALANVAANVIVGLALIWFGRTAADLLLR